MRERIPRRLRIWKEGRQVGLSKLELALELFGFPATLAIYVALVTPSAVAATQAVYSLKTEGGFDATTYGLGLIVLIYSFPIIIGTLGAREGKNRLYRRIEDKLRRSKIKTRKVNEKNGNKRKIQ